MTEPDEMVNVRHMVDDVDTAIEFYTEHLGFDPSSPGCEFDVLRSRL